MSRVAEANPLVNAAALRVLGALRSLRATHMGRAATDRRIAEAADVPERDVIDLVLWLAEQHDVAVLADGRGRYIESDPAAVHAYAERLHDRAKAIHGRAAIYRDLAIRMDARGTTESSGQGRLFSEPAQPGDAWARA